MSRPTTETAKRVVKQGLIQLPKEAIVRLLGKINSGVMLRTYPGVFGCPMYEALPDEAIKNIFDRDNEDAFWGMEAELKRTWKVVGHEIETNIKPGKHDYVECLHALSHDQLEEVIRSMLNATRAVLECQWCEKMMKSTSGLTLHEKSCKYKD
jgi:hypothetical protein